MWVLLDIVELVLLGGVGIITQTFFIAVLIVMPVRSLHIYRLLGCRSGGCGGCCGVGGLGLDWWGGAGEISWHLLRHSLHHVERKVGHVGELWHVRHLHHHTWWGSHPWHHISCSTELGWRGHHKVLHVQCLLLHVVLVLAQLLEELPHVAVGVLVADFEFIL